MSLLRLSGQIESPVAAAAHIVLFVAGYVVAVRRWNPRPPLRPTAGDGGQPLIALWRMYTRASLSPAGHRYRSRRWVIMLATLVAFAASFLVFDWIW